MTHFLGNSEMFHKITSKQGRIIILNGTSCAGKSTLTKYLLSKLGSTWKQVACDAIEDKLKESKVPVSDLEKTARIFGII